MTRIYVGNLPYDTSDADLRSLFERFGRVSSAQVITDRMTGKARGFGFVSMPYLEDADEAIARMNGSSMGGRRLTVNEAKDDHVDSPRPSQRETVNLLELIENDIARCGERPKSPAA